MNIHVKKTKSLIEGAHPNGYDEGYEETHTIPDSIFKEPAVGMRFWASMSWSTSTVQEILSPNSFRTRNAIYEWHVVS